MKIVSIINTNNNTNTLNLTIGTPTTIKELFGKAEVKAFAPEATIESIASYDGYDQASMEAVNMETLSVTDDTVIEITAFGEFKPQTVAAPQQGRVTILAGGGSLSKSVIIINGITTVRQALNDRVANAFDKTRDELQQMKFHVNDEAATLESTLQDGDKIVLEERKAGTDGCEDNYLTLVDCNGTERGILKEDPELDLESFLDTDAVLENFGENVDGIALIDDIENVDGVDFSEAADNMIDIILESPISNINRVEFFNLEFAAPVEEEPAPADDDDAVPADGVGAAQNIPAVGQATVGPVMVSQGGTSPIKILVTSGQTTLKDVVMSAKVLNTFAMTEQHMAKMLFSVNDVRSNLDVVLRAGDTVVVEAPKCGTDGSNC